MKVLLVSSNSGSRGGSEIYLERLARGLHRVGHEVHFLCSNDPCMDELAQNITNSAKVHRDGIRSTYSRPTRVLGAITDRRQQGRVREFLSQLNPDVVHVNQNVAEDGLDLLIAARLAGLPALSTIHITHTARALNARGGWIRDCATTWMLRRLRCVHIVVSHRAGEALARRLSLDGSQHSVRVVQNGAYDEDSGADEAAGQQVRKEWGIGPGVVVVGCVGRLEPQKNPWFLLDVLEAVLQARVPAHFVWIGDGSLAGDFLQSVESRGLSDSFTFDGWHQAATHRMKGLDIFVLTSRFEGLPLALLESMSLAIPACVSDVDGMPEVVVDGVTGFLCPLDDREGWISRLSQLATDHEARAKMGREACALAQSRFGIRRMTEETLAVYKTLLVNGCPTTLDNTL